MFPRGKKKKVRSTRINDERRAEAFQGIEKQRFSLVTRGVQKFSKGQKTDRFLKKGAVLKFSKVSKSNVE